MNLDNHEKSEFDGGILGLIGVNILSTIITFVTFWPWIYMGYVC